jgi:predicted small lipoprotein YifL
MRSFLMFLICTVVWSISGCGATGPKFSPYSGVVADQALLYVYRPDAHALSALTSAIEINGKVRAQLENNGYMVIALGAGSYQILQRWKAGLSGIADIENKTSSVAVNLEPGSITYVRLGTQVERGASTPHTFSINFRWELKKVSAADAAPEISQCRQASLQAMEQSRQTPWIQVATLGRRTVEN